MMDQNIQHKIMTHLDTGKSENGWFCTCGATGYPDTQESRNSHLILYNNKVKKMIYLASPHSHTNAGVRQDRYQAALNCTSWLIENGFWCFSPIIHSHNLPFLKDESKFNFEWWKEFDTETITRMDEVWVLVIPGTLESKGVRAEVEIAKLQGKKVFLIWVGLGVYRNVRLDFIENFDTKVSEIINKYYAQAPRL
jgi:Domain of unknown function (DUF1937)